MKCARLREQMVRLLRIAQHYFHEVEPQQAEQLELFLAGLGQRLSVLDE
jgi:hypothetical protein